MSVRKFIVFGATGAQGGSVARTFCQKDGWEVIGVTRNPNSDAATRLKSLGIKMVKASLDDVQSLKDVLKDAHAIYAVTDFWQFPQQPSTQEMVRTQGITWNQACYLQELQQGKNLIDAAAAVIAEGYTNLQKLIFSTLSNARKASGGKYTWAYHFDSKADMVEYLKTKAKEDPRYKQLLDVTSYIHIGYYLDNWKMNPILMPTKDETETFVFRGIAPSTSSDGCSSEPLYPFIHTSSDTGPLVEALIRAPSGTVMLGASEQMHFPDYVDLWGKINNVKTKYQPMSLEELSQAFPGGLGREVGESAYYHSEFGWDGGEGALLPEQLGVDARSLTSVAAYIKNTDWSSVLG